MPRIAKSFQAAWKLVPKMNRNYALVTFAHKNDKITWLWNCRPGFLHQIIIKRQKMKICIWLFPLNFHRHLPIMSSSSCPSNFTKKWYISNRKTPRLSTCITIHNKKLANYLSGLGQDTCFRDRVYKRRVLNYLARN